MTLAADKERVLKILRERKATLKWHRVSDLMNKNSEIDVKNALESLVTDGKVSSKTDAGLYSITTTTSTTTTTTLPS